MIIICVKRVYGVSFYVTKNVTKNIISGEGGALLVNDRELVERAEIIREKGTNRSQFLRGQVDKYTWVDVGSSYLPSELVSAFLWAQMEQAETITQRRLEIWQTYHDAFTNLEKRDKVIRPYIPAHCRSNAHMYQLLLPSLERRSAFIEALKMRGIQSVFHYVPLHTAQAGLQYGRAVGEMRQTLELSERLVRLPLWIGLEDHLSTVIEQVIAAAG